MGKGGGLGRRAFELGRPGEYYRNKYGGGGKGKGGGGGKGKGGGGKGKGGGDNGPRPQQAPASADRARPATELTDVLRRIDGAGYKAYNDLRGGWQFERAIVLLVDYVQADPFAMPSRMRLRVPLAESGLPAESMSSPIRRVALCDFLTRQLHQLVTSGGHHVHHQSGGWSGEKGGEITVDAPGQHVIERSSVVLGPDWIECRVTVNLPARGRSVIGQWAHQILTETMPNVALHSLFWEHLDQPGLQAHVQSVEDQQALREMLIPNGLIGFVLDGAVLPRATGAADTPMQGPSVVRFASPPEMRRTLDLPSGRQVTGMAIEQGITLIVGGGFHGKSTLLAALELGVYNHCIGDGREFVVIEPSAVKIRAEDGSALARYLVSGAAGRACHCVDIRPFINNLPYDKSTQCFETADASGSTSQAANIIEAVEAGSRTLLLDEDTCATNFMIRDHRMQRLIAKQHEPITPFIYKVHQLHADHGVSVIMVGCPVGQLSVAR